LMHLCLRLWIYSHQQQDYQDTNSFQHMGAVMVKVRLYPCRTISFDSCKCKQHGRQLQNTWKLSKSLKFWLFGTIINPEKSAKCKSTAGKYSYTWFSVD
jgi:hypothetical protein